MNPFVFISCVTGLVMAIRESGDRVIHKGSIYEFASERAAEIADGAWMVDATMVSDEQVRQESQFGPIVSNDGKTPQGSSFLYVTPKAKAQRWLKLGAAVWQHVSDCDEAAA